MRLLLALGWTAIVLIVLWAPSPPPLDVGIPHFDKYVHFALFAGIGVAWSFAGARAVVTIACGIVLGVVTEVVQGALPWPRGADVWDVVADAGGLVLAVGLVALVRRVVPSGPRRHTATAAGRPPARRA